MKSWRQRWMMNISPLLIKSQNGTSEHCSMPIFLGHKFVTVVILFKSPSGKSVCRANVFGEPLTVHQTFTPARLNPLKYCQTALTTSALSGSATRLALGTVKKCWRILRERYSIWWCPTVRAGTGRTAWWSHAQFHLLRHRFLIPQIPRTLSGRTVHQPHTRSKPVARSHASALTAKKEQREL